MLDDVKTRWCREEIAALYDRAQYLAGEVRNLPAKDAPALIAARVAVKVEAAADVLAQALRHMDSSILCREEPTAFCPYCRLTADLQRDAEGRTWRVCAYCGNADILATTNAEDRLRVVAQGRKGVTPTADVGS